MPNFTPKKDEDLIVLLKEGEGQFEVLNSIEMTSKNGDPMIKLLLGCWDSENSKGNIFDYLIFNENIFCQRKIKHFSYSCGLEKEYESGKITQFDCLNKSGFLLIGIQKDKTGQYPDKNCVYDYLKPKEKKENTINEDLDDDIPF